MLQTSERWSEVDWSCDVTIFVLSHGEMLFYSVLSSSFAIRLEAITSRLDAIASRLLGWRQSL